jgi:hypothetical protein
MVIYVVETWVLRPERLEDFPAFLEKWKKIMKEKKHLFKELKSWNIYSTMFGTSHSGMGIWEYESMADLEKSMSPFHSDPDVKKLVDELWTFVLPGTHREEIWKPTAQMK